MKEKLIKQIEGQMMNVLNNAQLMFLEETLNRNLNGFKIVKDDSNISRLHFKYDNRQFVEMFLSVKRIEGCSEKTLKNYKRVLNNCVISSNLNATEMDTIYLREYLTKYKENSVCSKNTLDDIRRMLSSFFNWLEEENYILKSPMKRIHKIKGEKIYRETYSDENMEKLRENVISVRDLAILDLLSSTGIRVGELVGLDIKDIDFENRECIVFGKGEKERKVYFDAKAKIHLKEYIESRTDDNPALFVSEYKPHERLKSPGIGKMLRKLGNKAGIEKVHPHKFRRTLATKAIDKGMPIEQVQSLLGHSQIDTTLRYALVNQSNVKQSHKKYIA